MHVSIPSGSRRAQKKPMRQTGDCCEWPDWPFNATNNLRETTTGKLSDYTLHNYISIFNFKYFSLVSFSLLEETCCSHSCFSFSHGKMIWWMTWWNVVFQLSFRLIQMMILCEHHNGVSVSSTECCQQFPPTLPRFDVWREISPPPPAPWFRSSRLSGAPM